LSKLLGATPGDLIAVYPEPDPAKFAVSEEGERGVQRYQESPPGGGPLPTACTQRWNKLAVLVDLAAEEQQQAGAAAGNSMSSDLTAGASFSSGPAVADP